MAKTKVRARPLKGFQCVRGRLVDYDAIRHTADAYATAAAYFNDFLNDEKMPTPDMVRSAISHAFSCCCDAQNAYHSIFPAGPPLRIPGSKKSGAKRRAK